MCAFTGRNGTCLLLIALLILCVGASPAHASCAVIWQHRSDSGPSPRRTMRLAYDSARGVTVLFGGRSGSTYQNDTWEWDGTAWEQRCVPSEACGPELPSPREDSGMAYDTARGVVVLYGGYDGSFLGDTWEWDGTVWTKVDDGDANGITSPAPRGGLGMVYDSATGVVVLYGGLVGLAPGDHFGDMWQWDGMTWTQLCQPPNDCGVSSPGARSWFGMTYDIAREVVVLFGGHVGQGLPTLHDTWEWDGSAWTEKCAACPPPNGVWPEMAYDSARGVSVRFGGWTGTALDETWEWDGANWTLQSIPGPPARTDHGMAYDSARGVTVLFGGTDVGHLNDTWEFGLLGDCEVVHLALDIKPGGCPNPLNVHIKGKGKGGVVPVALLGSNEFDIDQVVLVNLALSRADGVGESVAPLNGPPGPGMTVEDLATPFEGELCDCHTLGADGHPDLSLKFSRSELMEQLQLNDVDDGQDVELLLTGSLLNGVSFEASDCVLIVN